MKRSVGRVARKRRRCGWPYRGCGRVIEPGDTFVYSIMSPGDEDGSGHWLWACECEECAVRYGRVALLVERERR